MKQTWADGKQWNGFHFSEYSLDPKVLDLPLKERWPTAGPFPGWAGKYEELQTRVGDVYTRLEDRHVEIETGAIQETEIKTDTEKLVFAGPQFTLEIVYSC